MKICESRAAQEFLRSFVVIFVMLGIFGLVFGTIGVLKVLALTTAFAAFFAAVGVLVAHFVGPFED